MTTRLSFGAFGSCRRSGIVTRPSWGSEPRDESDDASDPMAKITVKARDLLEAAHDGYVYRADPKEDVKLLKREKGLYLQIRPPYVDSPEMKEIAQDLSPYPGAQQVPNQVGVERGG